MAEDVSGIIASIPFPILILAAEEDMVEPLERVKQEVCSRFPGAKLQVLYESGHLSPLDAPEAVANRLLSFLNGLAAEDGMFSFQL
jgi:pimeloyl-ACP methyl ester carboxylesterase